MRGRIINPFVAELAQLDTQATETTAPGYDAVFKEPRVSYDAAEVRTSARKEKTTRIRCQVETGTSDQLRMTPSGNAAKASMTLVFHFKDLECAGLLDADNRPAIRVNDRLAALYTVGGDVAQAFPNPPGLFVTEVVPSGFGFGGRAELVVVRLGDRAQAKIGGG